MDDIPYLVKHFIGKFSIIYKKNIQDIEDEALDLLINYLWPGNVRELENAIEYAFARTKDKNIIQKCKLPPAIRENIPCSSLQIDNKYGEEQADKILRLLEKYHWNKTKVAKELGIGRSTLWRRLNKLNLEK